MKSIRTVQAISTLLVATALAACGGGGGGGSTGAASTGAAVSQGTITAKGSIFVNGIEYNTSNATIKIDDNPAVEGDLKIGMTVKVRGTSDDATKAGIATLVEARDAMEGTIDVNGVDPIGNTITVMGQRIKIEDNITRLNDDGAIKVFAGANFQPGDRVEINGFPDDNGGLRATRVAKKAAGEFEIKGFVSGLTGSSFGLSLNPGAPVTLTVNFTTPLVGISNGSFVEVKSAGAPVAGVLSASLVKLEDKLGAAGEKVEIEGIVASGTVADFFINGQRVITNSATVYEGGVAADFALGAKLEAEGPLDANGSIVATKISFRSNIRLQGEVSAVSTTGLTVLGKQVILNPFVRTQNGPILNGDDVEVRATLDSDGNLVATRLIKKSPTSQSFLQGPVTAKNSLAGTMTILGLPIVTDSGTEFRLSTDTTEQSVTSVAFFARLNTNAVVKVRWDNFTSTALPVKQAEIELGK